MRAISEVVLTIQMIDGRIQFAKQRTRIIFFGSRRHVALRSMKWRRVIYFLGTWLTVRVSGQNGVTMGMNNPIPDVSTLAKIISV